MKTIALKPRKLTPAIARELEERNLISFVRHPDAGLRRELQEDFYKGEDFRASVHGFHSVTITYTQVLLSSHPPGQDEIVFLWDGATGVKPLYFVFALHKRDEYLRLLESGRIAAQDYRALLVPLNHPRWSSFVVRHGTVHCELTDPVSPGTLAPAFFVLEPRRLSVRYTREEDYGVELVLKVTKKGNS